MAANIEEIVIELDERPLVEGARKGNAALESIERRAERARDSLGRFTAGAARSADAATRSAQAQAERIVTITDRSRQSIERTLASLERRAAFAGKSPAERLIAERDLTLKRIGGGDAEAVNRVRSAYDKLIASQEKQLGLSQRLGAALRNPLQAAGDAAEGLLGKLGTFGTIIAGAVSGLAAVGTAAFKVAKETTNYVETLESASIRTGLSRQEFQLFSAAAEDAGVSSGVFEGSMRKLSEILVDSSQEARDGRAALRELVGTIHDGQGRLKPTSELFLQISDGIGKLGEGSEGAARKVDAIQKLFGRAGLESLPLFNGQLRAATDELKRLGVGLDEHTIKKLLEVDRNLDAVSRRWDDLIRKAKAKITFVVDVVTRTRPEKPLSQAESLFAEGLADTGRESSVETQLLLGTFGGALSESRLAHNARVAAERRAQGLVDSFERTRNATKEGIERVLATAKKKREEALSAIEPGPDPQIVRQKIAEFEKFDREVRAAETKLEAIREAESRLKKGAVFEHRPDDRGVTPRSHGVFRPTLRRLDEIQRGALPGTADSLIVREADIQAANAERIEARRAREQSFAQGLLERQVRDRERALEVEQRSVEVEARRIELIAGPRGELGAVQRIAEIRLASLDRQVQLGLQIEEAERRRFEIIQDAELRILELQRKRFDEVKREAADLFDVLIRDSKNFASALKATLLTALLTPIKDTVSGAIAGVLTGRGSGIAGAAQRGGGGFGGILGGLGSIVGVGAPTNARTPPFVPSGTASSTAALASGAAAFAMPFLPMSRVSGLGSVPAPDAMRLPGGFAGGLAGFGLFNTGSIALGPGTATTAAGIGGLRGALAGIGSSPMAGLLGGLLALGGIQRGGLSGGIQSTLGGALTGFAIGAKIGSLGGPLGLAIGAGAGTLAGFVRSLFKGAEDKMRSKIESAYGIRVREKNILQQLVSIAKDQFGGNLDVAIRSKPVLEILELYALSTGQSFGHVANRVRPSNLIQAAGGLFQSPIFESGRALAFAGLPVAGNVPAALLGAPGRTGTGDLQPYQQVPRIDTESISDGIRRPLSGNNQPIRIEVVLTDVNLHLDREGVQDAIQSGSARAVATAMADGRRITDSVLGMVQRGYQRDVMAGVLANPAFRNS